MEEAAPFNRPFFQKLYRIHDTADLLDNMALVSYENRLFERRAFHSDLPSNHGATESCLTVRGSLQTMPASLVNAMANHGGNGIFKEHRFHAILPLFNSTSGKPRWRHKKRLETPLFSSREADPAPAIEW
ncbi:hypothetical protein [Mesorhizobium silamurunense]|uniref:hypothetical protein n=1 Tax=Mesorhizobium silamurunense TaxID=499528 RepID=UPI001FEBD1D4|nr:hypothetical protein [Mesorhizobium silamurunense]